MSSGKKSVTKSFIGEKEQELSEDNVARQTVLIG